MFAVHFDDFSVDRILLIAHYSIYNSFYKNEMNTERNVGCDMKHLYALAIAICSTYIENAIPNNESQIDEAVVRGIFSGMTRKQ